MKRNILGNSGIEVTELCFGTLPMGPMQLNLDPEAGGRIIRHALDSGVHFIDTAEAYGTYPHIRQALRGFPGRVSLSSKSFASTYREMEASIKKALTELGVDSIDVFELHGVRAAPDLFQKRAGALECLHEYKHRGIISAVGISTHAVDTVMAAALRDDIDVIFPVVNKAGLGVIHGTRDDMVEAINLAAERGKGVYAMKSLGGGNLIDEIDAAFNFVRSIRGIKSVSVGMVSIAEVKMNVALFKDLPVAPEDRVPKHTKRLFIKPNCKGCGACLRKCPSEALTLLKGKAKVRYDRCTSCGYCAPECPMFSIRLV